LKDLSSPAVPVALGASFALAAEPDIAADVDGFGKRRIGMGGNLGFCLPLPISRIVSMS
jgi:hypothetical protein